MPFNTARYWLAGMCTLLVPGTPVSAQIRAAWPAPNVDVSVYTTVDQCTGATARVDSSSLSRLVPKDTAPLGAVDVLGALPPDVIETAKRCVAKYRAEDVDLSAALPWIRLYLQAGRDADAKRVAERRLSSLDKSTDSTSEAKRAQVTSEIASAFLRAVPARLTDAVQFVEDLQRMGSPVWPVRLKTAALQLSIARIANDTARSRQAADWVMDIQRALSSTDRQSDEYREQLQLIMRAQHYLNHSLGLDSLRKSTSTYIAFQKTLANQINANLPRLGTNAPAIASDFWFPGPPRTSFPTPGHVTLLLAQGPKDEFYRGHELAAVLRRYQKRFPNVDIVITRYTKGYFWHAEPPTPQEEAKYLDYLMRTDYGFPGTLAVETTDFWRLPSPDRRRINDATANRTAYGDHFWIIDRNGTVVFYLPEVSAIRERVSSLRTFEQDIADLIAILIQQ